MLTDSALAMFRSAPTMAVAVLLVVEPREPALRVAAFGIKVPVVVPPFTFTSMKTDPNCS